MSWWDEHDRKGRLLAGWAVGKTADAIAAEIGTTRAAVLAKVDRLRKAGGPSAPARRDREISLVRTASTARPPANPGRDRRQAALSATPLQFSAGWGRRGPAAIPAEPYIEVSNEPLDPAQAVSIEQLERQHCRWPLGGASEGYRYCGIRKVSGLPYCEEHARRAYQAPTPAEVEHGVTARPVNLAKGGRVDVGWRQESQNSEPAADGAPELETEGADA